MDRVCLLLLSQTLLLAGLFLVVWVLVRVLVWILRIKFNVFTRVDRLIDSGNSLE